MTRREKAAFVAATLDEIFPAPRVPLDHRDPFTLLVATVLSAQCTDLRVNQVTPRLFARAGDAASMARMAQGEIEAIIRPCGLAPAKAKAIAGLSAMISQRHGGKVPPSFEALEALPGVGHKTASVVMSHAFGQAAFPVDTHIHRLAWRWGLSDGSTVEKTEADLKGCWPESEWERRHLQIIYFGRTHCPARTHERSSCPICKKIGVRSRMDGNPPK